MTVQADTDVSDLQLLLNQLIELSVQVIKFIEQQQWSEIEISDARRRQLAVEIFQQKNQTALSEHIKALGQVKILNDQILNAIQNMTKENTISHYASAQKLKSCQIYKQAAYQTLF